MALIDGSYALITGPTRAIGAIIPDVTIEETGVDQLRVTDHPVEVGASVSDHAFKAPCERIMRVGWSDASGGFEGYSAMVYSQLLQLQASREPMTVYTGKRLYQNMLISLLSETTDETTEHALIATVGMREVIITDTQGGGGSGSMAQPLLTGSPSGVGMSSLSTSPNMPAFTQIPAPPLS